MSAIRSLKRSIQKSLIGKVAETRSERKAAQAAQNALAKNSSPMKCRAFRKRVLRELREEGYDI